MPAKRSRKAHDAGAGDDTVICGDLLVLQGVCGSDNHSGVNLFYSEIPDDVQDDLRGLLHALHGEILVLAMEVEAAGEDVGAGQTHEREAGAVRTAADGTDVGRPSWPRQPSR